MPDINWDEYTNKLYPLLDKYISMNVSHEVTQYLRINYSFFCNHTENLKSKVTKNQEFFEEVGVFIGFLHDNLRSLICLHQAMHIAPSAFVLRAIIEARCNARFVFQDPVKRFPLYHNYQFIERYVAHFAGTGPKLGDNVLNEIRQKFPYWFRSKKGELVPIPDWTTEKMSLKDIALEVGLESDYNFSYALTSKFVHCSSIIINAYQGKNGFSPIPQSDLSDTLVLTGAHQGIQFLKDIYSFFGMSFPVEETAEMYNIFVELDEKFKNSSGHRV